MIPMLFVGVLALLALVTQLGMSVIERRYPAQGQAIDDDGATINLVDIGPRNAPGPPLLLIHGASSNLEAIRWPLGDMLANNHRVLLVDRPGHGWSTRARLTDSTRMRQSPA